MAVSHITSEHPRSIYAVADRELSENKTPRSMWVPLGLTMITILIVKGLLITLATLSLSNMFGGLNASRACLGEVNSQREILKLHEDLQRLTALLHNISTDSRFQLCPNNWHWFCGQCYFFSVGLEVDRMWAESMEYCTDHNASLAIIQHQAEMEFILGHMSSFLETPFIWLGLTKSQVEGLWVWQDGTPLQNHQFIKVQWDSESRGCADLRGDGSVFACDCKAYGPWLCKKTHVIT